MRVARGNRRRPGVASGPTFRGQAISTFQELCDLGHLGPQGLRLVSRLLREELRRFPDLVPAAGWQQADYEDVVQEFLVDRIAAVTADLLARATDDASMGRMVRRSIRNWLIDWVRKTPRGALRRRLEEVLRKDDAFEVVPDSHAGAGRWRLAGSQTGLWSGSIAELVEAAYGVTNVNVPVWTTDRRRSPVADRPSIVAILHAVFTAAQGAVEVATLASVFAQRFPVSLDPVEVTTEDEAMPNPSASDGREGMQDPESAVIGQEEELSIALSAAEIVGRLSAQERRLVLLLEVPAAVQEYLGCGRSQAYHQIKRLKAKLRLLIGGRPDRLAVAAEVIELCEA